MDTRKQLWNRYLCEGNDSEKQNKDQKANATADGEAEAIKNGRTEQDAATGGDGEAKGIEEPKWQPRASRFNEGRPVDWFAATSPSARTERNHDFWEELQSPNLKQRIGVCLSSNRNLQLCLPSVEVSCCLGLLAIIFRFGFFPFFIRKVLSVHYLCQSLSDFSSDAKPQGWRGKRARWMFAAKMPQALWIHTFLGGLGCSHPGHWNQCEMEKLIETITKTCCFFAVFRKCDTNVQRYEMTYDQW